MYICMGMQGGEMTWRRWRKGGAVLDTQHHEHMTTLVFNLGPFPRASSLLFSNSLLQVDKKGKKVVSREDLRFALDQSELDLCPKHLRQLMDHLAVKGEDSLVDYARLLVALTPSDDPVVVKVSGD